MTRTRLTCALLTVVLAFAALTHRPPAAPIQSTQTTLTSAPRGTAPYRWHGYDIKTCQTTPILGNGCNLGPNWWTVTAHVAVWANGTTVVMAHASGYPYCDYSGYEISINGCSTHGGGGEIYVVLNWTNCILPFDLGCYSDFATMGFNAKGQYNSFRENWGDGLP
jgi:hypothetical protein